MYKNLLKTFPIGNRSVQVFLSLSLYLLFASYLPKEAHQLLYTISLFMKDMLLWILPLVVGFFIAYTVSSFKKKAPIFLLSLFLFEAISNTCSVWYAYLWGMGSTHILEPIQTEQLQDLFTPLWRLPSIKPSWWTPDKGTILGIFFGLLSLGLNPSFQLFLQKGKAVGEKVLIRCFSKFIPLFVLGFFARMHETRLLHQIMTHYTEILSLLVTALLLYIAFLFALGSGGNTPPFLTKIRNLLPAGWLSFSSGCSLSTMPWTIDGAAKNLENKDLAKALIPATTNIQQIGDCIVNSFLCVILCYQFQGAIPDLATWVTFSSLFVLARFATAAVLGGAIFMMLPIYESTLHFTPEMISLILALNVILDPIVTCGNVVANGALARVFEKIWAKKLLLEVPSDMS